MPSQASGTSRSRSPSVAASDSSKSGGSTAESHTDWEFPTAQALKYELEEEFNEQTKAEVWSESYEVVRTYYEELVGRWKEEMDTLLVYAGLFSAVSTAFVIESYQRLQPEPTDATLAVLQQISIQLNSFAISPPFVNSTQPGTSEPSNGVQSAFEAPISAIWINALWFSSLVCSLASASLALIVKQWLHEATVGLSGTSRQSARLRQHRLNGLLRWRVGTIVGALPIILQVALVLFLAGMIILLFTLESTVAAVTSSLVAILFIFLIIVTFLPVIRWECSYRSLQAFAIYMVIRITYNTARRMLNRLFRFLREFHGRMKGRADIMSPIYRFSEWYHYHVREIPTWHGRDQYSITRSTGILDRCIATTAYSTTLSPTYLERLHIIMSDIPLGQLTPALRDIWVICENHWGGAFGPGHVYWSQNYRAVELSVLYAVRYMLAVPPDQRDDMWRRRAESILEKLVSRMEGPRGSSSELYISTFGPLAMDHDTLAWTTSAMLTSHWCHSNTANKEMATYSAIRSMLAICDWRLTHWHLEEYVFENLLVWFRTGLSIFVCISRSSSQSSLTPLQLRTICHLAHSALAKFQDLLVNQEWTGLKPEKSELREGRRDQWPGVFPHRLSALLVSWVLQPLTAIYNNKQAEGAIPETLVTALENVWSTISQKFPSPLDVDTIRSYKVVTSLPTIQSAFETLRCAAYSASSEQHKNHCAVLSPVPVPALSTGEAVQTSDPS